MIISVDPEGSLEVDIYERNDDIDACCIERIERVLKSNKQTYPDKFHFLVFNHAARKQAKEKGFYLPFGIPPNFYP